MADRVLISQLLFSPPHSIHGPNRILAGIFQRSPPLSSPVGCPLPCTPLLMALVGGAGVKIAGSWLAEKQKAARLEPRESGTEENVARRMGILKLYIIARDSR